MTYSVSGNSFVAGKPERWNQIAFASRPLTKSYNLHPDGDRMLGIFAATEEAAPADSERVILIENFFELLPN
ncbi:MAG TPA: hypothetical protein VMY18_02740 [Acidobacteriota bacterium]|nr:hypothetical protein [Acidobacteriota bacterium]